MSNNLKIKRSESKERISELKALFKKTQSLPQIQTLSEDDILREVEAQRQNDIDSLRKTMDEISCNAQEKGLTPEILESLLADE